MCEFIEFKIRLGEILNLFAAIGIAIYIHFYIKRKLDDSRHLKNIFIEELRTLTKQWHEALSIIELNCVSQKIMDSPQKRKINGLITFSDLILDSAIIRINSAFKNKFKDELYEIKEKHYEVWKQVTGGELMNAKFIPSELFITQYQQKLVMLDLKVRELIIKINKC